MASIKNIQLKGIKKIDGREGVGFRANIYMDSKKIGSVADYADGVVDYDVEMKPEMKPEFDRRMMEYFAQHPEEKITDVTIFIYNLFVLSEKEKYFKRKVKQYGTRSPIVWNVEIVINKYNTDEYTVFTEDQLKQLLAENEHIRYKVFRSLDDFIIN